MTYYQTKIAALPSASNYDPRHIEGWMRAEHATLDSLSASAFIREAGIADEVAPRDRLFGKDPSGDENRRQKHKREFVGRHCGPPVGRGLQSLSVKVM